MPGGAWRKTAKMKPLFSRFSSLFGGAKGAVSAAEMLEIMRAKTMAIGGIARAAREWRVSTGLVYNVFHEKRPLGERIPARIGYKRVVTTTFVPNK